RLAHDRDRCAEGGRLAVVHDDAKDGAVVVGLELHRRLVGLDLGDDVALAEAFARALQQAADAALLHGVGEAGHGQLLGHGTSLTARTPEAGSARRLRSWTRAAAPPAPEACGTGRGP